jgi:hypothetical protein
MREEEYLKKSQALRAATRDSRARLKQGFTALRGQLTRGSLSRSPMQC